MSTRYELIIFDWDGTLMDSLPRIVFSVRAAAQEFGLPLLSELAIHEIVGLELGKAISALYPELDAHHVERFRERYAHHYVQNDIEPSAFFDGILPMLDSLRERPTLLSIATGKSRRGLDRVMVAANAAHYFHSSRCADETESKPSPRMVLDLLELHGVAPEKAVVVGDTEFDMAMAQSAGVARLGVGWGAHALERLERYSPQACFHRVNELAEWLLA